MLSSLTSRSKDRLESVYATGHERTVLFLCKSADKKVRRGAARLLGRLSTLVLVSFQNDDSSMENDDSSEKR